MKKFNLIFGILLVSVLMISLVSAGVTSYVIKEGGKIGEISKVERIYSDSQKVQIDGKSYEKGDVFTTSTGESYEIKKVEKAPWIFARPSVDIVEVPTVCEKAHCIFDNSTKMRKCYTSGDASSFSCSGIAECVVSDVCGPKGKKLEWKSTCGGYKSIILDGDSEDVEFSCAEEVEVPQPCETYILSESGTNTFVINGQPVGVEFNEDGFWFDANQGPISDLFSWSGQFGGGFTFLGQTITILEINEEGMIIKIKVCPEEEPSPQEGPKCNLNCRWVFNQEQQISSINAQGQTVIDPDAVAVSCDKPNEIVFEGSCHPGSPDFVRVLHGFTVTGKEWGCNFENYKSFSGNPVFYGSAGALCCVDP